MRLKSQSVKNYKKVKIVKLPPGKNVPWGAYPDESLSELVREEKIDAAVFLIRAEDRVRLRFRGPQYG